MSVTDWPCDECGALAGEPCAEDCKLRADSETWDVEFSQLEFPDADYEPRSMDESLAIIAEHVHRLPFGNLVGIRGMGAPDRQDYEPAEYLDRLAGWLEEYQPILRAMVDELQEQSRQRIGLQIERDVLDGVIRRALDGADA
jgi:hypothetical protein